MAAGETLTAAVLEEVQVDAHAVPPGHSTQRATYEGKTVATALPSGALVHESQLVGPSLLEGHAPGTVAVPVRPADTAMIGLLSPGQHVDVLVSSDAPGRQSGTRRVAENAPVLWIPRGDEDNWLGSSGEGQQVIILAVDAATAEAIAQAAHEGRLHVSLRGGP